MVDEAHVEGIEVGRHAVGRARIRSQTWRLSYHPHWNRNVDRMVIPYLVTQRATPS
jgi:hypothetical protein